MIAQLRRRFIALGVLTLLTYLGGVNGAFHFDDGHSIESNPAVHSLEQIPSFWMDARTSSFIPDNRVYRPLVYTLYAFCWALGHGSTVPFHLLKILFHWGVAVALYLVWRRLFALPLWWLEAKSLPTWSVPLLSRKVTWSPDFGALALAVIWIIHPAATECVDYVSATTSLQCAFFYVWAYWVYLRERLERDVISPRTIILSLFLFFLSVASKEEGITLPAMIAFTEFFVFGEKRPQRLLKRVLPWAGMALLLAAWVLWMRPAEGRVSRGFATSAEYFMTQWRAYLWYFRLWFWPWDLNADYAAIVFSKSPFEPVAIQALIGNSLVILTAFVFRRRAPAFFFGVVWYYVTISPASSVVVLAEAINEHRMYLAYFGFAAGTWPWIIGALDRLGRESRWSLLPSTLLILAAVGLVWGVQQRHNVWATSENLWSDTLEKNPTSGRAMNNLALVYMGRAEYSRALTLLADCERYWPNYLNCPLNAAVIWEAKKDWVRAEASYARAQQLGPGSVYVHFHLGNYWESSRGDCARAIPYYQKALELTRERHPVADLRLAKCKARLGQATSEIQTHLKRAVEIDPTLRPEAEAIGRMQGGH